MKKLLLASSLFFFFIAWSCNTNKQTNSSNDKPTKENPVVVDHGSPDQAKLDSIKAAKTSGKQ